MRLILPKTKVEIDHSVGPVFFLAGPVRGGGDWQASATKLLSDQQDCYVVNPCRYTEAHPLLQHGEAGDNNAFIRQTLWERYYLQMASEHGCVVFWLPYQSVEAPRMDGSPYARDTYGELGEWRGRLVCNPNLRIVIGAAAYFPGLSVITANFNAVSPGWIIYPTLEETLTQAVRIGTQQ